MLPSALFCGFPLFYFLTYLGLTSPTTWETGPGKGYGNATCCGKMPGFPGGDNFPCVCVTLLCGHSIICIIFLAWLLGLSQQQELPGLRRQEASRTMAWLDTGVWVILWEHLFN